MLKFIKKLFAQEEEKQEEKISLDELSSWLDKKTEPLFGSLKKDVKVIIKTIDDEKEKTIENLKKLENTKLQNPNIPNRAKTIMEGNRAAFMKKVSHFFNNIDLKFENFDELIKKCKNLDNEMDSLAKSTARSYTILNEFFAREIASVAGCIKKVENYSKEIKNSIQHLKIHDINEIKNEIDDLQNKVKSKERLLQELGNEKRNLEEGKSKQVEIENKIKEHKEGEDYNNFEKLMKEREEAEKKLKEIEDKLFHDFSDLEKAFKKYAKIAFENEKLIEKYSKNPAKALIEDNDLEIIKIIHNLEKAISENKLELEQKKSERSLMKIKRLDKRYFATNQNNSKKIEEKLDKIKTEIENNKARDQLEIYNKEFNNIKNDIENLNNKISLSNNEIEKIDIVKLKENLQEEVNKALN